VSSHHTLDRPPTWRIVVIHTEAETSLCFFPDLIGPQGLRQGEEGFRLNARMIQTFSYSCCLSRDEM